LTINLPKTILLVFFVSAGMNWAVVPGLGTMKATHIGVVLIILFAGIHDASRRNALKFAKRFSLLTISFIAWSMFFLLTAPLVPFGYSASDAIVTTVYLSFIFALSAVLLCACPKYSRLEYHLGASVVFGMLFTIFVILGVPIQRFILISVTAIGSGAPNQIMFGLFGGSGLVRLGDGQAIIGLRHSMSMILVVALMMMMHSNFKNNRSNLIDPIILLGVFFLVVIQSRSAWLCFAFAILLRTAWWFINARTNRKSIFLGMLLIFPTIYVATLIFPLISNRANESQSSEGRTEYALAAIEDISNSGLFPGISRAPVNPHNFILESGVSGGYIGLAFSAAITLAATAIILRLSLNSRHFFAAGAASVFLVRLFTSGSNLPEIGGSMGLAFGLYVLLDEKYNRRPKKTSLEHDAVNLKSGDLKHTESSPQRIFYRQ